MSINMLWLDNSTYSLQVKVIKAVLYFLKKHNAIPFKIEASQHLFVPKTISFYLLGIPVFPSRSLPPHNLLLTGDPSKCQTLVFNTSEPGNFCRILEGIINYQEQFQTPPVLCLTSSLPTRERQEENCSLIKDPQLEIWYFTSKEDQSSFPLNLAILEHSGLDPNTAELYGFKKS